MLQLQQNHTIITWRLQHLKNPMANAVIAPLKKKVIPTALGMFPITKKRETFWKNSGENDNL